MGKKNIGSSFDEFLQEEAILEDATAVALKRVIAWQIAEEMKVQQITKTELAKRMHTSRAALNRLLDDADAYAAMARAHNPFGDGTSARRIVDLLAMG